MPYEENINQMSEAGAVRMKSSCRVLMEGIGTECCRDGLPVTVGWLALLGRFAVCWQERIVALGLKCLVLQYS